MVNKLIIRILTKLTRYELRKVLLLAVLVLTQLVSVAQEKPPRPISVYVSMVQDLSFGAIIPGPTGGSVIVYANGSRVATGDVILGSFGFSYSPAIFEIEGNIGTLITISNGPNITLSGNNGGSLSMEIGNSLPVSPFILNVEYPTRTFVYIGGILNVNNITSNPEGSYNGSFQVTFIQQ